MIRLIAAPLIPGQDEELLMLLPLIREGLKLALPVEKTVEICEPVPFRSLAELSGISYHDKSRMFVLPVSLRCGVQDAPTYFQTNAPLANMHLTGIPGRVWGSASPTRGLATGSVHALRHSDVGRFHARVVKIAVHEVGHLLGVSGLHCANPCCLMGELLKTGQLDRTPCQLCEACCRQIRDCQDPPVQG